MITRRSSLADVALALGDALRRHGIRAVLTGGACASLHTGGDYQSRDVDFVLVGPTTQARLDGAMASVGFLRRGDSYVHPRTAFYVEFPRGPLAIGSDHAIRPVERRRRGARALILSATDSCRDRLAAFYHWNDRSSLAVAVAIALRRRVDLRAIRRWSLAEGSLAGFEAFLGELERARRGRGEGGSAPEERRWKAERTTRRRAGRGGRGPAPRR